MEAVEAERPHPAKLVQLLPRAIKGWARTLMLVFTKKTGDEEIIKRGLDHPLFSIEQNPRPVNWF